MKDCINFFGHQIELTDEQVKKLREILGISNVDAACNKFADEIAELVGKGNLVEHTVDLTSDDGLRITARSDAGHPC